MTGPNFRPSLLAAKQRLAEGRAKLAEQHARGSLGVQVCARLTDLLDNVLLDLFEAALADLGLDSLRQHLALVPHGGYGRRDVAPFSDVDLMVLHSGSRRQEVAALATRLMQDLYDAGLVLGHSARTPAEAVSLARDDMTIYTSLVESRFLAGSQDVYDDFRARFTKMTRRRYRSLYEGILAARRGERAQFGETVYLLTPNLKRSRGGLRDIQLLRWIGFAKFGISDPDALYLRGALSKADRRLLKAAGEFLLRTRNEMHFHTGKAHDILTRHEQVRLAERFGFKGGGGLLPVEQFMREYFRQTSQIGYLVSRFVQGVRPATPMSLLAPVFSHQVEGDYRVSPYEISATRQTLEKLKQSLDEVLRLADLANLYDRRIDHATWEAVCRAVPNYSGDISEQVAARFLSLLAQPNRLGELLRRLHELGVLEKIVPAFTHARCLLQFNEYHKFTVDEHCIRAVEHAAELIHDEGPLGKVYRGIKQKHLLHLALLLHDLGKGFAEDHSEVGLRIAEATCRRLGLPEREAEIVKFLVHKHLMMSHLAFRRDTSDERLVVRFAVEVGSLEVLQMLYVLTCADLAAVGPGTLGGWKLEVLTHLYQRASQHLAGSSVLDHDQWLAERREGVRQAMEPGKLDPWCEEQVRALPVGYLQSQPPDEIAGMLRRLRGLGPGQADAWGSYQEETQTAEYTIIVEQGHGRGVFSRLTGALTSQGLVILSAEINSLAGQAVLDRFIVEDPDYAGAPPPERIARVCKALLRSLDSAEPPKFRKIWGKPKGEQASELSPLPTVVKIDNNTSDTYTIIDVFTFDRTGLLYAIARALFELKLSIGAARIGTYLDQVVDVFYVTDQTTGEKIADERRIEEIRGRLLLACSAVSETE